MADPHLYLIALGSNQRHPHFGGPAAILESTIEALESDEIDVFAVSPIVRSRPIGPSRCTYANAAAVLASPLEPRDLLDRLQAIEADYGRIRRGQSWQARTLDLDIILWSGGSHIDSALHIPHPAFRERGFVVAPATAIAANWRDPVTGLTLRQIEARFTRAKPLDPRARRH